MPRILPATCVLLAIVGLTWRAPVARAGHIAQPSGQFPAICGSGFRCELTEPISTVIDASPGRVDITAASPFTLTLALSPTFEQLTPGIDLQQLTVTRNFTPVFAEQRYSGGQYLLSLNMDGEPGNYTIGISFTVQEQATTTRAFTLALPIRVRRPATATPTPQPTNTPTPRPTNTPLPGPTNTPLPGLTSTPEPAASPTPVSATRWYLPIAYQDWCASAEADWCEPNGSLTGAFDRLSVGRSINATVRAPGDRDDVYRVTITDTTPVTISIAAPNAPAGADLDMQLYSSNRVVCESTFTSRNDEQIIVGATPCSADSDYRTTRLPPGVYYIRVNLFSPPANASDPVQYSLSIAR
jgi:hypothetical protein